MNTTILDRLHQAMLDSGRSWTAVEVGETCLRIKASPSMAARLVSSVLRGDSRFLETADGLWSAVPCPSIPLSQAGYVPVWLDTGGAQTPDAWVLWLRSGAHQSDPAVAIRAGDPASWDAARRRCDGRRPATIQAGAFGRFQQWMCRRHAVTEWDPAHLDLVAWTRIALVLEGVAPGESLSAARLPEISRRWNLGPFSDDDPDGALRSIDELLSLLLERHGSWTDSDLDREWERHLAGRPVDTSGFAFRLDSLADLPERCGIYRFYDSRDTLLYVGKAANLARRVRSYFRPYPPERSKREDLMLAVRRFEYDLLPSEIEALIRETRAIRTGKPLWNVQVEVSPEETLPPGWWWPLAFAARGDDAGVASVFVLDGAESGYMFRIPPEPGSGPSGTWSAWLESLVAEDPHDSVQPPEGVELLEAPESRLALRYFLRHRDALDRVEPCHVPDGPGFLQSLKVLAAADSGSAEPVLPRPA